MQSGQEGEVDHCWNSIFIRIHFEKGMDFHTFSPTTLADVLPRKQIMRYDIRPLWTSPRVAGPAFTVQLPPGKIGL